MKKLFFFKSVVLPGLICLGMLSCKPKTAKVVPLPEEALLHYWDNFDFKDAKALKNPEIGEQTLVNFIAKFPDFSERMNALAMKQMLAKAKPYPASFIFFTQQLEHYLYDPNSPQRNDAYYAPVIEFLLDSCELDNTEKYRYSTRLQALKKNRIGMLAPDFSFRTPGGGKKNLSDYHRPFVLLFFYEPGCPHCEVAIEELRMNAGFNRLIEQGILDILSIYAMGDLKSWKVYQSAIPATWVNGFDTEMQILSKGLYEIRATPTIYLLDKDRRVVLKDTDLSGVAIYLNTKTAHHSYLKS